MISIYATNAGEPWSSRELIWQSNLNSKEIGIYSAKLKVELNKAGSLEFTVSPTHPYYYRFRQMTTMLTVVCGGSVEDTLFRGRVSKIVVDAFRQKKITAEEVLAFLNDSVLRPFGKDQRKSAKSMFYWAITAHNNEFPASGVNNPNKEKQFITNDSASLPYPSIVDLTQDPYNTGDDTSQDPNTPIDPVDSTDVDKVTVYSESSYQETFKFIDSELIDELGGYLRVHYDDDYANQYIDWVSPDHYVHAYYRGRTTSKSPRVLMFGSNIIDIQREQTTEDLFTVLLPSGDNTSGNNKLTGNWSTLNDPISIYGLDGAQETIHVNWQGDAAYIVEGVAKYGYIYHAENFSGVKNRNKLLDSAKKYISNNYKPTLVTYKVKALDADLVEEPLRLGERVYIPSTTAVEAMDPYVYVTNLRVTQADYDILEPQNTQYTVGLPIQTLTEKNRQSSRSGGKKSSDNENKTDNTTTETKTSVQTLEKSAVDILGRQYVKEGAKRTTTTTTVKTTNADGSVTSESKTTTTDVTTKGLQFVTDSQRPGTEKSVDARIYEHRHVLNASISNDGILHMTLGPEVYSNYGDGSTSGIDSNGNAFVNFNMANSAWFLAQKEALLEQGREEGRQQGASNVSLPSGNVQLFTTDSSLHNKSVRVYYKLSSRSSYSHHDKRLEYSATYPNDSDL